MQCYFIFFINFSQKNKKSLTRKSINECAARVHQRLIDVELSFYIKLIINNIIKINEESTSNNLTII